VKRQSGLTGHHRRKQPTPGARKWRTLIEVTVADRNSYGLSGMAASNTCSGMLNNNVGVGRYFFAREPPSRGR